MKKMVAFLYNNTPLGFDVLLLNRILDRLRGGTAKVNGQWAAIYQPMCKRPSMYAPTNIHKMLTDAAL